ncbi:class III lanthionine synthetase LanKC [Couchioplanes caeruleus]|uniref:non-specific serine/threonine protein kinase n=2 Tax=Couchioplanes caeruleus TaxID=56438 RepID=A0A1K0FT03_9ACTN|nr:class III lanthionine synthetase LanKC [Couchioplanes caeruleus]OJF15941.1 Serine threonine protein kinase [Couchioplanes caeruleus subsp. caeruleus]ROP28531.1 protein kinase-like protein [Couchioplanes caeruleus]
MKLNPERLQPFCLADPLFFDTPERIADRAERLPAADRETPAGWTRTERGLWVSLRPPGVSLPEQGWKIHASATLDEVSRVCDIVWEYCVAHAVTFKFLRSAGAVRFANNKYAHRGSSGKALTLYPVDEAQLGRVLSDLSELLSGVPGPYILSDLRYGDGPLYVRYGGFSGRTCPDADGEPTPALAGPDGKLVPDVRGPAFRVPPWVTVPEVLRPHLARRDADHGVDFPYEVERALHFSNGGGVYVATHRTTGERVVLREARPHAGLDRDGADAIARLARERAVLERLASLSCVPRVLGFVTAWEHHFLVEEYVEGDNLLDAMVKRQPLLDPEPDPAAVAEYVEWVHDVMSGLECALTSVHARGIRFGDLHPANVMVRPDGRVVLVDFELATDLADEHPPALAAPGFTVPRGLSGAAADRYLFHCIRLWMFLPVTGGLARSPADLARLAGSAQRLYGLPASFPADLAHALGTAVPAADAGPAALLGGDQSDWPAIRASLIAGIHAGATPDRADRLFPGDPNQFATGGYTLAYGAAGVLHALHVTGAEIPDEYVTWMLRSVHRAQNPRPGLYDGLLGAAAVLYELGRVDEALDLVRRAVGQPLTTPGLFGGVAGAGVSLLHFARATGDEGLRAAATRMADALAPMIRAVATGRPAPSVRGGLLRGMSGPALFLLHLYEDTGDPAYLDLAGAALRADLACGERLANGTLQLVEEGRRYLLYLDGGSGGLGLVLQRYLRHRDEPAFRDEVAAIGHGCRSIFVRQPGLFRGRAGLIAALSHLPGPENPAAIAAHVRRLGWHAETYQGHLAFPGDKLMRLSMDLATGSAGILLALSTAFEGTAVLPYLDARVPAPTS